MLHDLVFMCVVRLLEFSLNNTEGLAILIETSAVLS
jgi:hypothetical protein